MLVQQGHKVIWWSSDFSHLTKSKRKPCPDTDGFSVRLIETPPYAKNISFARLKNHRQFAQGFYQEAMSGLENGELKAPNRIVVSLPPLGVAEQAFRIRDAVNRKAKDRGQRSELNQRAPITHQSSSIRHQASQAQPACQVIVDIKDAWPETFYRAIPKPLRQALGPILLKPMHRSARRAYQGADKISAVGQSYLDLAKQYLKRSRVPLAPDATSITAKPLHLCYHGTDLERFSAGRAIESGKWKVESKVTPNSKLSTLHCVENGPESATKPQPPLQAVYLGSMSSGYDLETIIEVAERWKKEGLFPFQIHFAGDGPKRSTLEARCKETDSQILNQNSLYHKTSERVIFHGYIGKDAVTKLLLQSDLALVPNRPASWVACPAKICELTAAGLPILSCLGGELKQLLDTWNAGSNYNEGNAESLDIALKEYADNRRLLKGQGDNAKKMARALFDRNQTYYKLTQFILKEELTLT
ncbi:glycosyltransferase [Coraliomargarita sp. SDUM461003]|uniref:Glycosyltransferase n=1 Tax=Thalassobacterium maritimum TaxID=3041265 RepID=A0ABU1B0X6_9BACT|nr:glycosyltransferase [Coraliomargarita sp. SDUM461003]MDQ8209150.1 glycosyltransferase [Coraliomargarita sp. SDUM461003]